ncbi:LptF/LptG family permease [Chlamydiifrater volucris]|uniref:LptF/LptG family permease n=1 Tax=Chlamydiifrater volucris TaxID=2681470 RepID=UPI001BCD9E50|nr:LptF/LptG family permease [Chlamydiifrater volucris]
MKLWQRHLLLRFWTIFLVLVISSFLFYSSIHHSLHVMKSTGSTSTVVPWKLNTLYYLSQIGLKSEFLFPQLIAVTTTLTLSSMQHKREVSLLQASGLSLKQFLSPLLFSVGLITVFLYANFQWLYPACENISLKKESLEKGSKTTREDKIPALYLKDQTVLIYSSIDRTAMTLNKVFWIKSRNEIYSIERLAFNTLSLPMGFSVMLFKNQESTNTVSQQFFDMKEFPEIEFGFYDNPFSKIFTAGAKNRLSEIFGAIPWKATGPGTTTSIPQRIAALISHFYYRLFSPLACLAATIVSAAFCLRFSRTPKVALAYLVPLSLVNIFFVFLKAGMVLSSNSVLPVLQTMVVAPLALALYSGYKFANLR